jgi:putative restriction endonuclease
MNEELDAALRTALFAHIAAVRDVHGDAIPSAVLNQGFQFRGERVPIWNQQLGIYRPAILREPGAALTIQTAFKGPYDDRFTPDDDKFAYRYRGTDPNHNDNRALRRAMAMRLPLLYLVALKPGLYRPIYPCYVVDDSPQSLTFYLVADVEGYIAATAADSQTDWPRKAYVTRQVLMRLHQERFRVIVLDAYREQCSMCRLRHPPLLDAAHILPDRDPRSLPEVQNGLSLCKIHHSAFDVGIIGVDPDHRIHVRDDVLEEHDGPMLRHGLQELHNERLELPRRPIDRPNRDFLAERFEKFVAA